MNEYVQKAINGDKDAFTLIFLNLQNDMYNIARARTKTVEDTYDAIQETINCKKLAFLEKIVYNFYPEKRIKCKVKIVRKMSIKNSNK